MNCRGCGTDLETVDVKDAVNKAVDDVLEASVADAVQTGGVCPLCGHSKAVPLSHRKSVQFILLLACLLLLSLTLALTAYYRSPLRSSVAQTALEKARHDPRVVKLLGAPIRAGWLASGTVRQDETGWGEARMEIPIRGPKGKATLRAVAGKGTGPWVFSSLEVVVEGRPKSIDLVPGSIQDTDEEIYSDVHFQPALQPELLPANTEIPAWDGAYPYVVITPTISGSDSVTFQSSIRLNGPSVRHDSPVNEFRVDLHSGLFVLRQTDLFVSDVMPLSLTRTYRPWDGASHAFGAGANHPYDVCPTGTRNPYTYLDLNLEDGRQIRFPRISKGTGYADAAYRHGETASEFYGAQIVWNGNGWDLNFQDRRQFRFPESYNARNFAQGAAIQMRDARGHHIELKRDPARNLDKLTSPSGHTINFKYDKASRIIEAQDDSGNIRKYTYNPAGHLETVSDGSHVLYRFGYENLLNSQGFDPYLMTTVTDGRGRELIRNWYEDGSRVSKQRLADGETYLYDYLFDSKYNVTEATVTLSTGETKRFFFESGEPLRKK
jgi:YD repeat-containing protein